MGRSYEYITEALNSGKNVVTANKAVVSKYFEELSALASEKNLAFLYEASVGGGIPVIKPLKEQLAFNEISEVQGILNGTCNYILTRMIDEGKDYDEVLKIAQELDMLRQIQQLMKDMIPRKLEYYDFILARKGY